MSLVGNESMGVPPSTRVKTDHGPESSEGDDYGEEDIGVAIELDEEWLNAPSINGPLWLQRAAKIMRKGCGPMTSQSWVAAALACAVLEGADSREVCFVVQRPLIGSGRKDVIARGIGMAGGAKVVLAQAAEASRLLHNTSIPLWTSILAKDLAMIDRLEKAEEATAAGAATVEVMASPEYCQTCNWTELYMELVSMYDATAPVRMAVVLPTEELCTLTNTYKATLVAMMAGAAIVSPSTCPDTDHTLATALVMVTAVQDFYLKTGRQVGVHFNGLQSASTALIMMSVVKDVLGKEWFHPDLFSFSGEACVADLQKVWQYEGGEMPPNY